MAEFLTGDIVGDKMRQQEDRNYQLMLRQQQAQQDRLARGIASIYAEPQPQATTETATVPNYGIAPNNMPVQTGLQQGYTVGGVGSPNASERSQPALSGFNAPNATTDIPSERQITQTVPAGPDTRQQRALALAARTPGGGNIAMQLAQQKMAGEAGQLSAREKHLDRVHGMLSTGNIAGAKQYAQMYGLNELAPMFNNPRALAVTVYSGGFAHKNLGLDGHEAAQFTSSVLENMSKGMNYEDAFMQANKDVASQPLPYKQAITDNAGNVTLLDKYGNARPATGVKGKARVGGGGGGPRSASNTVQRSFSDAAGNMWALMRDGTTKQLMKADGAPLQSSEVSKFAGNVYLKNADMPGASVQAARDIANQMYPAPAPQGQPAPTIRKYNPNTGKLE